MSDAFAVMVAAGGVPGFNDWLGARELQAMARYEMTGRRADWRAGRWAAKRALGVADAELASVDLAGLEILAAPDGAPELWLGDKRVPVSVSISHRDGLAAALVCHSATAGCDLEMVESRTSSFAADWFCRSELAAIENAPPWMRDVLVALIWSAKESVLKVTRQGLRADTREAEIAPIALALAVGDWQPFTAHVEGKEMAGWWRLDGRCVMTAVTHPAGNPPVFMDTVRNIEEKIRCS